MDSLLIGPMYHNFDKQDFVKLASLIYDIVTIIVCTLKFA